VLDIRVPFLFRTIYFAFNLFEPCSIKMILIKRLIKCYPLSKKFCATGRCPKVGKTVKEVEANRIEIAQKFAEEHQVLLLWSKD
jgi:hypothetical protein